MAPLAVLFCFLACRDIFLIFSRPGGFRGVFGNDDGGAGLHDGFGMPPAVPAGIEEEGGADGHEEKARGLGAREAEEPRFRVVAAQKFQAEAFQGIQEPVQAERLPLGMAERAEQELRL